VEFVAEKLFVSSPKARCKTFTVEGNVGKNGASFVSNFFSKPYLADDDDFIHISNRKTSTTLVKMGKKTKTPSFE
jgi:hypothetical protein